MYATCRETGNGDGRPENKTPAPSGRNRMERALFASVLTYGLGDVGFRAGWRSRIARLQRRHVLSRWAAIAFMRLTTAAGARRIRRPTMTFS